jgi:hypothetical protein
MKSPRSSVMEYVVPVHFCGISSSTSSQVARPRVAYNSIALCGTQPQAGESLYGFHTQSTAGMKYFIEQTHATGQSATDVMSRHLALGLSSNVHDTTRSS